MPSYHFERALFVVGEPNSGKSNQLRRMFRDVRLGTGGDIPTERRLPELYRLSNELCLYLRLTSPHEAGETIGRKRHGRTELSGKKTVKTIEDEHSQDGEAVMNFRRCASARSQETHAGCRKDMPGVRQIFRTGTDAGCVPES